MILIHSKDEKHRIKAFGKGNQNKVLQQTTDTKKLLKNTIHFRQVSLEAESKQSHHKSEC